MSAHHSHTQRSIRGATRAGSAAVILVLATALVGCDQSPSFEVTHVASPAGAKSAEPHLSQSADGTVVLSWLETKDTEVALHHSTWNGGSWGPARTVATGDNWFVNWADFPSVTPMSQDLWAAHWLVKRTGGTYAYDVAVALSHNAGDSWSAPTTPHTDGTRTEHGFVSLYPKNGGVGVLWLDGRQMAQDASSGHSHGSGGMTLRSARLSSAGLLDDGRLVDELVCDCCQTDVAITTSGPVAVYRNRTDQEIRDVYLAREVDGAWLTGRPVAEDGWRINGCPVNGPAIVADGQRVAVAWFTAAHDQPKVRAAISTDSGATFQTVVDIDAEQPTGRVDITTLDASTLVVSWFRKATDGNGEVAARAVSTDGTLGPIRTIVHIGSGRSTGFPQMARHNDTLVFAWTDTENDSRQVQTARLAIDAFR